MPKAWNKRHKGVPKDAVYVGRPTKWGNPYSHQKGTLARFQVATREEAVRKFHDMIMQEDVFWSMKRDEIRSELKGKDLVCWCAPKSCHADILLEIANEP